MPEQGKARRRRWLVAALAVGAMSLAAVPAVTAGTNEDSGPSLGALTHATNAIAVNADRADAGEDEDQGEPEALVASEQYALIRTAPALNVSGAALLAARAQASALPTAGGAWQELTDVPYQSDSPRFNSNISNVGAGNGLVTGRITALAVDPAHPSTVYAGAADGGVWASADRGRHWTPIGDQLPSLSIGSLAVNPADGSLWVATGEANTSFDAYQGVGVWRYDGSAWSQVGGAELDGTVIAKLTFSDDGTVYVATSKGVFQRVATDLTSPWTLRLDAATVGGTPQPYGMTMATDVVVRPGTSGRVVVAVLGWRNGADYNGMYVSRDGGHSFSQVTLHGIDQASFGRASLAYSADGRRLYAVVEDWQKLLAGHASVLQGVYENRTGDPAGPWFRIADQFTLAHANPPSALLYLSGYRPGVQAWYNQWIAVDPHRPGHVYVGLEEVYDTRDAGATWHTIGPYWNFPFPCFSEDDLNACPNTTHPDQHAVAFGGRYVYVGNDGGVWRRRINASSDTVEGWQNLNRGLDTLQYYGIGAGTAPSGHGLAIWGGMQDNGNSLLRPNGLFVEPAGGDGATVLVDPNDGNKAVVQYVYGNMHLTVNGGRAEKRAHAFRSISPSCNVQYPAANPCDPGFRFIAPIERDVNDPDHWLTGGLYVWDNQGLGFRMRCNQASGPCDWKPVWSVAGDDGTPHSTTALAANGRTEYAAWCGPVVSCNPSELSTPPDDSTGFSSGIDTNYDPTHRYRSTHGWHHLDTSGLPNRYVNRLVVDPNDPAHVYAVYAGFSRRWIPAELGPGVGHLYESHDGGASWTDVSGDLPDAPATDLLLLANGKLVLSTDVGVFYAPASDTSHWTRLGTNLPAASVNDLQLSPNGSTILAGTHGRGIWRIAAP